jgi:FMN phosphatase YigB (HAD superfamily)
MATQLLDRETQGMESRFDVTRDGCLSRPASATIALRSTSPIALSAVILDLDHVLYDASCWQRWLLQLLHRMGLQTHYQAFFRTFERDFLENVYLGRRDYWDALQAYLLTTGMARGRVEEVLAAGHGKHRELWRDVRPLPGVIATLTQLTARGVRLAVLSNTVADDLSVQLDRLGVAGRFEIVLSSRELGVAKPTPACYQAVIRALDLPEGEIGFVGHDTFELAGAGLAGLTTFAINHGVEAQADVFLSRFEELLCIVAPQRMQRAG